MQTFRLDHTESFLLPLSLPEDESFMNILSRVLRLPSVASKRYLTNKVRRLFTSSRGNENVVCHL